MTKNLKSCSSLLYNNTGGKTTMKSVQKNRAAKAMRAQAIRAAGKRK